MVVPYVKLCESNYNFSAYECVSKTVNFIEVQLTIT